MQRGPREREARYLQFTIQRPGSLTSSPYFPAHVVLTVDTCSPTILTGWDAATTSNQQVILQTLDEYTFGLRRGKWREIFRKKNYPYFVSGCFLLLQAPEKWWQATKTLDLLGTALSLFIIRITDFRRGSPWD